MFKLLMKSITALAYFWLMCSLFSNASATNDRFDSVVDEVFTLLTSTPSWPLLDVGDEEKRKQIDRVYIEISRYDSAAIRVAMEKYIHCSTEIEKHNVKHSFSVFNLMVLNRFVFNVPERISKEEAGKLPFYLGMAAPQDDKSIHLLWPLVVTKDMGVVLREQFYARGGPLPDPLGEFDVFGKAFGRRVPAQRK
ncbi:MAG: hypothetical protein QM760_15790 [Nibricoccus sp.]